MNNFLRDVLHGLSTQPKHLSSKYFYDATGSKIFQAIMNLDEYYLTRSEFEIFSTQKDSIVEKLDLNGLPIDIIELGAGDGLKTKILLKEILSYNKNINYRPIDISRDVLDELKFDLEKDLPELNVSEISGDYLEALIVLQEKSIKNKRLILFVGSNIGNFTKGEELIFLKEIAHNLDSGDFLLTGFDLVKDPKVIIEAYNDNKGVTKSFNLNLLSRINCELGADFDLNSFIHYPIYSPLEQEARSYLVSTKKQTVTFKNSQQTFHLGAWEAIHTETSRKYTFDDIHKLCRESGFELIADFLDSKEYFTDSLWRKI